jgi:hypothetical protein
VLITRIVALSVALVLTFALAAGVAAQAGPVGVGEPATYVSADGLKGGTVTVTEVLDPYTGFPEDSAPEPGTRFVVVTLAFEGTGEDGIDASYQDVWLHDTAGVLWGYEGSNIPSNILDDFPQPELDITTVGPGSRISGYVAYALPDDVVIQEVVVRADSGVLLLLADVGGARPEVGTPVTITNADGATVIANVKEVEDPYKGFKKGSPPADGGRFVMVTASFENTGDAPFEFKTGGTVLRDANGAMWAPTSITPAKKPKLLELKSVSLGRGNRVSGRLGYQVPADVALDGLYYQGDGRLFRLADLSGSTTEPPGDGKPTCAEIQGWWGEVVPILERVTGLPPFKTDAPPMDLAASKAMLAELEAIVADHLAVTPPDTLRDEHRRILGALLLYAQFARDQVASQEASDATLLFASQEAFEAAQLALPEALAVLDALVPEGCDIG